MKSKPLPEALLQHEAERQFTGWLRPDGSLLACRCRGDHLDVAWLAGESDPDGAGWTHYDQGRPEVVSRMTRAQLDRVVSIAAASGLTLEDWVSDVVVRP